MCFLIVPYIAYRTLSGNSFAHGRFQEKLSANQNFPAKYFCPEKKPQDGKH